MGELIASPPVGDIFNQSIVMSCFLRRQAAQMDMSPLPANASNYSQSELLAALQGLPNRLNGWNIPPEKFTVPDAACHWTTFSAPSDFMFYLVGTLYLLLALIGLMGNVLVIVTICRSPILQTTSNLLIFSLSCSDLLMLLKTPIAAINNWMRYPIFGAFGCQIYGTCTLVSALASIWAITAITYERYRVITSGFSRQNKFSVRTVSVILTITWTTALAFSIFPLIGWNAYVFEGYLTTCTMNTIASGSWDRLYTYILLIISYVLPLAVIVFCNVGIIRNNQRNNKEIVEVLEMRKRGNSTQTTLMSEQQQILKVSETLTVRSPLEGTAGVEISSSSRVTSRWRSIWARSSAESSRSGSSRSRGRQSSQRSRGKASPGISDFESPHGNPAAGMLDILSSPSPPTERPSGAGWAAYTTNIHVTKFKHDRHLIEIRLAKVAFFLIMVWALAWTPYAIVFVWSLTPHFASLSPVYDVFPAIFAKSSAALNPYIYGLCLPKFRREFKRLVRRILRNEDSYNQRAIVN